MEFVILKLKLQTKTRVRVKQEQELLEIFGGSCTAPETTKRRLDASQVYSMFALVQVREHVRVFNPIVLPIAAPIKVFKREVTGFVGNTHSKTSTAMVLA